ncbi:hypothetical protein Vsou_07580 [Vulcanisaeta souniana JCM 11219]|uniref:Uncharacterized protein n=1 Tax=Vulcanisaeta souniana JCM 11219 TaxID=1293586 RepID=A0A830EHA5_9CREN|nr:hypothetical protein Vsou_07580 [Vulcanisaeta souniana JCM 11219]GGI71501.1 hypothetical protein GCM10007112_05370 [Vulcanisaeta souniana JCM 11219]
MSLVIGRGLGELEFQELNRRLIYALFRRGADVLESLRDCVGEDCVTLASEVMRDVDADINYIIGRISDRWAVIDVVVDGAKIIHSVLSAFAGYGLLSTDFKVMLEELRISDNDDNGTKIRKALNLYRSLGGILMHMACRARYKGIRVGSMLIDKYLLLLGMAIDNALINEFNNAKHLLAAAYLALYGKETEASIVLKDVGFNYDAVDAFLGACAIFSEMYEHGIRFTEDDLNEELG